MINKCSSRASHLPNYSNATISMNIYHHNGLFIESSSLREYYKIITEAISLNRKRQKRSSTEFIYYENHHVLPRSMFPEFQLEKCKLNPNRLTLHKQKDII